MSGRDNAIYLVNHSELHSLLSGAYWRCMMHIMDDVRLSDSRLNEWLLREKARKERKIQSCNQRVCRVITISREYGAGGAQIAAKVCERLGTNWQVWDKEIINAMAESAQVRSQMVESLDEHAQTWLQEICRNILNSHVIETHAYYRHLAQVVLALAQQGNKIVIGRGANFLLPRALNVRLRAALDFRIRNIMDHEHLSREEAERKIRHVDRERMEFTRQLYSKDIDDPAGYDMIIRTDNLGIEPTVAAIISAACDFFK